MDNFSIDDKPIKLMIDDIEFSIEVLSVTDDGVMEIAYATTPQALPKPFEYYKERLGVIINDALRKMIEWEEKNGKIKL